MSASKAIALAHSVLNGKPGHVRVLALAKIRPSPENDMIYHRVRTDDPTVLALAKSIREHGLKEALVISEDRWILSGHRRYVAARLAGLTHVPCRVEPIRRRDDLDEFTVLLREYNRQREKSLDEKLREELVSVDPDHAFDSLLEERRQRSRVTVTSMRISGHTRRCEISKAKRPFLEAVQGVIEERKEFLPLSDRQIHYALLNDPPLIHASKPRSRYANSIRSYKSLTDLLTRARLEGLIEFEAIADETRPVLVWNTHREPSTFIKATLDGLFRGYWRDRMQSQPNHIEIVGEKNTLGSIIQPIASEYCIPLTTGRGYCSLPPRRAMAQRFEAGGKEKLVLLILTDHDPDGEEIAHSFARSMRDDFDIYDIHPVRVALTAQQVQEHKLPTVMTAKTTSVHHDKFVAQHGHNVFELEALPPAELQRILRQAIDSVIDVNAYNREVEAEHANAAFLAGLRKVACEALKGIDTTGGDR
jgi:ParB-like chromosome segregation protein Spo0J